LLQFAGPHPEQLHGRCGRSYENAVFGQHLAFIGHVAQSVCLDRKMMMLALVTCERSFLKARHSLRNGLPAGQEYS
jgi:hypothetical protein